METTNSPACVNETKVCRSISLELEGRRQFSSYLQRVTAASIPSETVSVESYLKAVTKKKVACLGRKQMVKLSRRYAPTSLFFQTVHACFAEHYPLALRPEVLMHLIVNEVATTVKLHPEEYRHLFSDEAEKQRIDVRHDGLVKDDPESPWHEAIALIKPALQKRIPSQVMELMLPEFSTHTVESECASLVAFMDAAAPFYDYHTHTMCGIPEIRLLGEADDYSRLLAAARGLAPIFQKHLGLYFEHLIPVLQKLENQAQGGELDKKFWSSLYKYASASGSDTFNGWITTFVNYVQKMEGGRDAKGELVQKKAEAYNWENCENGRSWGGLTGLALGSVPSQVSEVPFTWHYYGTEIPMSYAGGVLGIDNEDGYLTPALSFAILESPAQ